MTSQFWWGLAMLPLGAMTLAVTLGLAAWTFWAVERYRTGHTFTLRDKAPEGPVSLAALVALSKWGRQIHLPLNYRITITRDRPGSSPRNIAAATRYRAIQDALRNEHDKGA